MERKIVKIKQLVKNSSQVEIKGSKEVEITSITSDSRIASPGSLFIAKKGASYDGSEFIQEALSAGAVAVVTDFYDPFLHVAQIVCKNPEGLEPFLAAKFYDFPSKELYVVGVTGTKGKTTTSYLIHHLLEEINIAAGLIGTVETIVGKNRFFSTLTTHGVIHNQKLLREMVNQGAKAAVLEVSSHGLDQNRVDEIGFDVGVFTNLSPDHLDYHKTVEEYAKAKQKLFRKPNIEAVLNADSPYCAMMQEGRRALTFGIEKGDVRAKEISYNSQGMEFVVEAGKEKGILKTPLFGRFNIYNLLGAVGVGLLRGEPLEKVLLALSTFKAVPGRLERVENSLGIQVFVDFAHSGEPLENVLKTLKEMTQNRLIVVFGAGGDRPKERRKTMAMAAEKWADQIVVTTDNPRSEDPEAIASEIVGHFHEPKKAVVEIDRKSAIFKAIFLAKKGDTVLIAGKGHEKVQIFSRQTILFDDVEVAKDALICHSSKPI